MTCKTCVTSIGWSDGSWWVEWISCLGFFLSSETVELLVLESEINQTALGMEEDIHFQFCYWKTSMCTFPCCSIKIKKNMFLKSIHIFCTCKHGDQPEHSSNHINVPTISQKHISNSLNLWVEFNANCVWCRNCLEQHYIWHKSPIHSKGPHLFICNEFVETLWWNHLKEYNRNWVGM